MPTATSTARAVGALAAIALACQGRFEEGRALRDRAFADPVAALIRDQLPAFEGYWVDLPAGRLDDALVHIDQAIAAFERVDPFGRLPYVLLFKFAIHEERGEDEEALALAARGRELARQTGLAGWLGAGTSIRIASLRARLGDMAGAEAELADVGPGWLGRRTWEHEATRAVIAAARGERAARPRAAAERAAHELGDDVALVRPDALRGDAGAGLVRAGAAGPRASIVEATLAARPAGLLGRSAAGGPGLAAARGGRRGGLGGCAGRRVGGGGGPGSPRRPPGMAAAGATAVGGAGARRPWTPSTAVAAVADALPGGAALGTSPAIPWPPCAGGAAVRRRRREPEGIERLADLERDPDPGVARRGRAAADRLRRDPPPLAFRLFGSLRAAPREPGWSARRSGSAGWPRDWFACSSAGRASR